jgi:hypothetical protein
VQLVDHTYRYCTQPQQPYFELLDHIHQHLLPRSYVEVGVSTGRSLTLALPGTVCIGIDPDPRVAFPLNATTTVYPETSDDFFARHRVEELLGRVPLDLAFIDGMHNFEFALRDFINLEKASHRSTTILIHDCLPNGEVHAARERQTVKWAGDIWRLVLLLRAWRPDLDVVVADSGPSGLGIVQGLDPASSVLSEHYEEIVEQYLAIPYRALDDGTKLEQLNRVPGDWTTVRNHLPAASFREDNVELLKARRLARALGPASVRALHRAQRHFASKPPTRDNVPDRTGTASAA